MIKILIYLYSKLFGMYGGGAKSSILTVKYLRKLGHRVKQFSSVKEFEREIEVKKPDLALHNNIQNMVAVQRICLKYCLPIIVTINGLFTCGKGTHIENNLDGKPCLECSFGGLVKCTLKRMPYFKQGYREILTSTIGIPYRYARIKKRLDALNNVSAVIAVSNTMKRILRKNGVKTPIFVCPQPISDEFFVNSKRKDKINKIMFVGGLDSTKGALMLLKAFNELKPKNTELLIVGPNKTANLKAYSIYLNKGVKLLRKVAWDKMIQLYCSCDFLVFPSLLFEPFGRAWGEALACGLPVLCFKHRGGASDYLTHSKTGYLVEVGVNPLKLGMEKLLNNRKLRLKLSRGAKRFAKENLLGDNVAKKLDKIYMQVLK